MLYFFLFGSDLDLSLDYALPFVSPLECAQTTICQLPALLLDRASITLASHQAFCLCVFLLMVIPQFST